LSVLQKIKPHSDLRESPSRYRNHRPAKHHPGTKLAYGPVLEIVQAVTKALELLPYDTAIGPEA
jgi:hypothetical protein